MNLERAKKIRDEMDHYIQLTESYITKDTDTFIIKHYAFIQAVLNK